MNAQWKDFLDWLNCKSKNLTDSTERDQATIH